MPQPSESGPAPDASARLRAALGRHGAALAAAAAGLAWFGAHVGFRVLDPTRVGWLMQGDLATDYLGWAFFRSSPPSLPLGVNPYYPWPVGSSLALTDSIPLLGVALRPLAPLLPVDFQYVGPWLALCFALQGFAGAKLVRLASPDRLAQALGGALLALAPPLLHRIVGPRTGHASLCAHWLVLSALWLALAPVDAAGLRRRLAAAGALVALSTGVHPYLTAMALALSAALLVRLLVVDRIAGWRTVAVSGASIAAVALAGLAAFGFVAPGVSTGSYGFGTFSADALALVNPMGWSRAWDGLRIGPGQYEGFGYLGGGVVALALAAVTSVLLGRALPPRSRWRAALPAAVAVGLLALFSLSDEVTVAGASVARVGAYGWIPSIGRTFRSSGRFVWPLHYLVALASVAALAAAWRERPRFLSAALAAALAVQAADVRPPVPMPGGEEWAPPPRDAWAPARGRYRHVALVPAYVWTGAGEAAPECPTAFAPDAYVQVASVAYPLGATTNSAYLARIDRARAGAACADLVASVAAGRLDPETIYVPHPSWARTFSALGAACGRVGGIVACVDGSRTDPFAAALRSARVR